MDKKLFGIAATFKTPDEIINAAKKVTEFRLYKI